MPSETPRPTLKLDTTAKMPPPSSAVETPRPILKLNTASRQQSFSSDAPTPSTEKKTIKIKIAGSQPSTPAATPASQTKTKAGRSSKPTPKLIEAKKRTCDDSDDEDRPMAASRSDGARPNKMIKIKNSSGRTPTTPFSSTPISSIKFKPRGEPVEHHPGDAYDSEASDKETDPTREQSFILRVMPGVAADYLRKALAEGLIGVSKLQGGADFGIQFIDAKERRALVTIDGHYYAAVLVDLPTITEAMKTWDRKNMMKNSDISQMLLCFAEVRNEHEARVVPLPTMAGTNEPKWPHGITPPMHDAQNRRFRKVISEKQWQSTAAQVKKLIEDDDAAEETHVEWLDDNDDAEYDDEEDADGEVDGYFPPQDSIQGDEMDVDAAGEEEDEDDDDLLAEMEAAMAAEEDAAMSEVAEGATPAAALEAPTPMTVNTPGAGLDEPVSEEDEAEDVSDEDEDDEDEEDEEKATADKERREKMVDLKNYEEQLRKAESDLLTQTNNLFKSRLKTRISALKKEIAVKRAGLGITGED